jgi:hypothetical protein
MKGFAFRGPDSYISCTTSSRSQKPRVASRSLSEVTYCSKWTAKEYLGGRKEQGESG